ncbi:hypothetical protein NKH18_48220 [Streptomyces sp. M10(2022)]
MDRWIELEKSTGGGHGHSAPVLELQEAAPGAEPLAPAPAHRALSPQRPRRPARRAPSRRTRRRTRRTMRRPRRKRKAPRSPCRSASS